MYRFVNWKRPFCWILLLGFIMGGLTLVGAQTFDESIYLPYVQQSASASSCQPTGEQYQSISVIDPNPNNVAEDVNYNFGKRGFASVSAAKQLVNIAPVTDPNAPQLYTMFSDNRVPNIRNTYHRYRWNNDCDCPDGIQSRYETTVIGLETSLNELLRLPDSGYDIGGGNEAIVLYADSNSLTVHYGREDDLFGYVLHVESGCVDPNLVTLYEQRNGQGRDNLPTLRGGQPFGRAVSNEVQVVVRDVGSFLDPRSRNDWWQGR